MCVHMLCVFVCIYVICKWFTYYIYKNHLHITYYIYIKIIYILHIYTYYILHIYKCIYKLFIKIKKKVIDIYWLNFLHNIIVKKCLRVVLLILLNFLL